MKSNYKLLLSALAIVFALSSCEKSEDEPKGEFENGTFITNEGAWGNSNASVSFISEKGEVIHNIFKTTNNRPLGDVFQSMIVAGDLAYLIVNNSNKVEIVDVNTFEEVGAVKVDGCRYATFNNENIYISQWINGENGSVTVMNSKDFSTNIITDGIGNGPESILSVNDEVWVTNVGTYTLDPYVAINDSTVSVINTLTNNVIKIILEDKDGNIGYNPSSIISDDQGDVWVLAKGIWSSSAMLFEIDATSKLIKNSIKLLSSQKPSKILYYANNIYYGVSYGSTDVYRMDLSSMIVPSEPFIKEEVEDRDPTDYVLPSLYGLSIDNNGNIFACYAPDFTGNGFVKKYDSTGKEIATFETGVGPNGVVFNN